jgi:hypothetical protein
VSKLADVLRADFRRMKLRNLAAVGVALTLVLGACADKKHKDTATTTTTENPIDTSDAPIGAGPAAPTTGGATSTTPGGTAAAPGRMIALPWPAPEAGVSALITRAGLPALPQERLEYHIHAHVDVFLDGAAQAVPANLGIDRDEAVLSPLHTHDQTGIIHVENDKPRTFFLGQLMIEWDIRLDSTCAGSYCRPDATWAIYVDGTKDTRDPSKIEFAAHREIAIVIGKPPTSIPKKYDFPNGV